MDDARAEHAHHVRASIPGADVSVPAALVLSRVVKAYRAGVPGCSAIVDVLAGVSLTLGVGELATIEGSRGAGKSTLLLCAAGLLRPDAGEVRWPSLASRGATPAGISYAANRAPAHGLLTVREALAWGGTVHEAGGRGSARRTDELLVLSGLSDHASVRQALLGAAERERVLLALALVASPRLLLVDDLVGGDHAAGRAAFAQCLARVAASGTAVLWATTVSAPATGPHAAYRLAAGRIARGRASAARRERAGGDGQAGVGSRSARPPRPASSFPATLR